MSNNDRDLIKETDEWIALDTIWRSCTSYQKESLRGEFKLLSGFIRKHIRVRAESDDYGYLNALSPGARAFVIELVESGEKNLYHSFMSIINNPSRADFTKEQIRDIYFEKYADKRPYLKKHESYVLEVLNLCWSRQK